MKKQSLQEIENYLRQGETQKAKSACDALLTEFPNDSEIDHTYAIILAQQGDMKEALNAINRSLKQGANNPKVYNSKGNICMRLGKNSQAINAYKKAIECQQGYAPAYNNLGNCYLKQNRIDAAESAYLQAIRLAPQFVDAHFNYGRLLLAKGNQKSATQVLQHAYQINPKHSAVLGQLAEIMLIESKYTEASRFLLKRLQLQPTHAESYHRLGYSRFKLGEYEAAIEAIEHAMSLGTLETDCHTLLASSYIENNQPEKALAHYLQQLELTNEAETHYNIGVILMAKERHREAVGYFNNAITLDPSNIDAILNLGALYLKLGQIKQAIIQYETALKASPNNAEYQHILNALKQKGDNGQAPVAYVKGLFDHYAYFYDQHLEKHLKYDVPKQLHEATITFLDEPKKQSLKILDLGCGTGLCGQQFKPWAKQLIGIDLSEKMIHAAEKKEIYDELTIGNITDVLSAYQHCDLILAADVFTYIGDLERLFQQVFQALTPGGAFLFTVEKGAIAPFHLQRTIRYGHHRQYLLTLIEKNHFETACFDNMTLRQQFNKPIDGYLIGLTKPTEPTL